MEGFKRINFFLICSFKIINENLIEATGIMSMYFCNATGVWTGIMFQDHPNYCSGKPGEIYISNKDKKILQKLAEGLLVIATDEEQNKKCELWYNHNSLKSEYPLILADPENGWNEIITEDLLECEGNLARRWEVVLRKEIFWGESIRDDKPIEPYFYIGYTYTESDWGVNGEFHGGLGGGSYIWDSPIKDIEDVNKLKFKTINIDYKSTLKTYELANCVFENLLEVKLRGVWWWGFGLSYELVRLIGLSNMMTYVYDKPELIHRVMKVLRDGNLAKLDFLEKNNLLYLNNGDFYVGSGGIGYCRELPKRSVDCLNVKTEDMWGHAESQETSEVSPAMFEEFIFQYQLPILKRFGLNCYGCCEPLDKRWHIIKNIPNLRRVSVSPWADLKKMSEYLEDKYIFSMKPNPADLAVPNMDEEGVRKKISEALEITKGCILEIIMKDNHTLGKNPNNIVNWVKIVREEIEKIY